MIDAPNGADGYGHNAFLVGNDNNGWTLISKEGRKEGSFKADPSDNALSGGPALPMKFAKISTIASFLQDDHFKEYTRVAIFSVTQEQASMALNVMEREAGSQYSLLSNNCAHAVNTTLSAIGLSSAAVSVMRSDQGDGVMMKTPYLSPIPNTMYTNTIVNNLKNFIVQYAR